MSDGPGPAGSAASGEQVRPSRDALLDAATKLFAERGPAAVSTREIAAAANVNNGLIHRHFGTKDELLRQTMLRLAAEIAAAAESDEDPASLLKYLDATYERSAYWRLLARCILDGQPLDELQTGFPTMQRIVSLMEDLQARGAIARGIDPKLLAPILMAAGLGWLVFEPFLVSAAGLEDEDLARVRHDVRKALLELLVGPPKA